MSSTSNQISNSTMTNQDSFLFQKRAFIVGYVRPNTYKMITTQSGVTYEDARYMCINDYGMDLVVICDDDVMTEVKNYLLITKYAYLENIRTC